MMWLAAWFVSSALLAPVVGRTLRNARRRQEAEGARIRYPGPWTTA